MIGRGGAAKQSAKAATRQSVSNKATTNSSLPPDCAEKGYLTTGELAKHCGATLRTVRFYEGEGLIEADRSCGGHRAFDRKAAERLKLILDFREAGLSLAEIRELFELKSSAGCPQSASKNMTSFLLEQQEVLARKIATLERLKAELSQMQHRLEDCASCKTPSFPQDCGECEKMQCDKLPRALRVLWKRCN